jgi:hypothetical protein
VKLYENATPWRDAVATVLSGKNPGECHLWSDPDAIGAVIASLEESNRCTVTMTVDDHCTGVYGCTVRRAAHVCLHDSAAPTALLELDCFGGTLKGVVVLAHPGILTYLPARLTEQTDCAVFHLSLVDQKSLPSLQVEHGNRGATHLVYLSGSMLFSDGEFYLSALLRHPINANDPLDLGRAVRNYDVDAEIQKVARDRDASKDAFF